MEQVKQYFTSYPESKECHETADGFLFHDKQSAGAHAGTLGNKAVKTHRRDGFSSIPGEVNPAHIEITENGLKMLPVTSEQEMVDVVVTPEMVQENPELPFAAGDVIEVTKVPKEEGESGTFTNDPAESAPAVPVPPAAEAPKKVRAAARAKPSKAAKATK